MEETPKNNSSSEPVPLKQVFDELIDQDTIGNPDANIVVEADRSLQIQAEILKKIDSGIFSEEEVERLKDTLFDEQVRLQGLRKELGKPFGGESPTS